MCRQVSVVGHDNPWKTVGDVVEDLMFRRNLSGSTNLTSISLPPSKFLSFMGKKHSSTRNLHE